jgi:hypothetical protein
MSDTSENQSERLDSDNQINTVDVKVDMSLVEETR